MPAPELTAAPAVQDAAHDPAADRPDPAELEAYLASIAELKAGDLTSRKLLALTANPDYDMREVVRCVECDPALTARLLRVVNGSRYGLRHRVTGVRRAAAYLGRRSLRLLAVTFSLADRFSAEKPLHADVWRRAVLSAAAAAELAKKAQGPAADEAYTAALLSDVGVMLLGGFDPQTYPGLHADRPHGAVLLTAERARFGTDHADLGGKFLSRWGLPEELSAAAAGHHGPAEDDAASPLESVVRCSNLLAEAVLRPDEDSVLAADELIRRRFPDRPTGRVLAGVLNAAAEDADLYPGGPAPDRIAVTIAWAGHLSCPELELTAAAHRGAAGREAVAV